MKIKRPKNVKEFVLNLEKVVLDVPLKKWGGVYYNANGEAEEDVATRSSTVGAGGCLVQQALTNRVCGKAEKYEDCAGTFACTEDDFVIVAPFLKKRYGLVKKLVAASDAMDVKKAIIAIRQLAAKENVLLKRL